MPNSTLYRANKDLYNHIERVWYSENKDEINRKRRQRHAARKIAKIKDVTSNGLEIEELNKINRVRREKYTETKVEINRKRRERCRVHLDEKNRVRREKYQGKKDKIQLELQQRDDANKVEEKQFDADLRLAVDNLMETKMGHKELYQAFNQVVHDNLVVSKPRLLLATMGKKVTKCSVICGSKIFSIRDEGETDPPTKKSIATDADQNDNYCDCNLTVDHAESIYCTESELAEEHDVNVFDEDKLNVSKPRLLIATMGKKDTKCSVICGSKIFSIRDEGETELPIRKNIVIDADENNSYCVYDLTGDHEESTYCSESELVDGHDDNAFVTLMSSRIHVLEPKYVQRFKGSFPLGRQFPTPPNDVIHTFSEDQIHVRLHHGVMQPSVTEKHWLLLEQLSWTPVSTKVHGTKITKTITISKTGFNNLVPPYWLKDDLLDFMITYLFRGTSNSDSDFSHLPCSFYQSSSFRQQGRKISQRNVNILKRDLIFQPINIKEMHWVLAVIVKPTTLLATECKNEACILYVDPQHPHLSSDEAKMRIAFNDRSKIHTSLLQWLNYELVPEDSDCRFDALNCKLLYSFGTDGKFLLCVLFGYVI